MLAGANDVCCANSISLALGLAAAPPWFAGAMGPIESLANSTISRANSRVSYALSEGAGSLPPSARKKSFSNPFGISPGNTAVRERII